METRTRNALHIICAVALIGGLLVAAQGAALAAEPNCQNTHGVERVANNWRLTIHTVCNSQALVYGIKWYFAFWSEQQGGGGTAKYYTNGGQPYPEMREKRTDPRKPSEMLIQVDAPGGGGRYCYQGNHILDSPSIAANQKREYWTGTNCKDT